MELMTRVGQRLVDDLLPARVSVQETEDYRTTATEYCLRDCSGTAHATGVPDAPEYFCGQHVHRSVDVIMKRWPAAMAEAGGF